MMRGAMKFQVSRKETSWSLKVFATYDGKIPGTPQGIPGIPGDDTVLDFLEMLLFLPLSLFPFRKSLYFKRPPRTASSCRTALVEPFS